MLRRVSFVLALVALTGCQGVPDLQAYMPRDETPVMPAAFAVEVPRGPSSQRLNARGYPMLGYRPRAAGPQADAAAVAAAQARYANVATRGSAPTTAGIADLQGVATQRAAAARNDEYQRSIEELQALAREQRADR